MSLMAAASGSSVLLHQKLDRGRQAAIQIFERLRGAIIDLTLTPGTVLQRASLAEQFGVSSTPVRDALMRLEEEGLVEIFPQHATIVSPIDLNQAHQAHFLRRSLEIEVVRTVAALGDPTCEQRLRLILGRQAALHKVGDLDGFAAEDETFHRALFEVARVPDLWPLVRSRSGHLDRLRRLHLPSPGKATAILRDHEAIVDAIATGDEEGAEGSMRRHLGGTLAQVEELRQRFPQYIRG